MNPYVFLSIVITGYFLPWLLAWMRGHRDVGSIFMTTLVLGWTGLGWLFALIWSLSGNVKVH